MCKTGHYTQCTASWRKNKWTVAHKSSQIYDQFLSSQIVRQGVKFVPLVSKCFPCSFCCYICCICGESFELPLELMGYYTHHSCWLMEVFLIAYRYCSTYWTQSLLVSLVSKSWAFGRVTLNFYCLWIDVLLHRISLFSMITCNVSKGRLEYWCTKTSHSITF